MSQPQLRAINSYEKFSSSSFLSQTVVDCVYYNPSELKKIFQLL